LTGHNFIVYKSSAGSGKTFTLVREYLKIVLLNPDLFRNVLAITFTNKAANEMKERVVKYLIALADPEIRKDNAAIKSLLPQLSVHLKMNDQQIFERAEKVLRLIMHHYGEFSISTIDSFTHRVIRTFAHDLDIPMNFEVELEADAMLEEAVDELISLVGTDPQLTRVLIDFVEKKAGDEMSWQIEKDLYLFGKALLDEDSIKHIGELRKYDLDTFMAARGRLINWVKTWEGKIRAMVNELLGLLFKAGLDVESLYYKDRGVFSYLVKTSASKSEIILPKTYARKSLAEGVWLGNKVSPSIQAGFDGVKDELVPLGIRLTELLDDEFARYSICRLLLNNLYATALLGEIEKILYKTCQEDNKLLISEFNRRISAIVREQPAPFIYERLGERYQHYLLDEFQDTSIMQWHNLLPLIENALASNRMNMVVGDAKQAIYRWRSGDARQFEILPKLIRDLEDPLLESREKALEYHFQEENLEMNHRSSPVIVDFNNRFFQGIVPALPEGYGNLYASASQTAARNDKPGMVRIEIARKDESKGVSYEESVYEKILAAISELKQDGYSLKDVAILCRRNKEAANIAVQLIKNGISVISMESLLLTQSEHVNFFLAWARHLVSKSDPLPVATITHYLYRHNYLKEIDYDRLCLDHLFKKPSISQEDATTPEQPFPGLINTILPDFDYFNLKNLDLQGLFRFLAFYFRLDFNTESHLRFFMDYVMEFMRKSHGGIAEFLEWWEERSDKASLIIPEGIDAIRIMTIHKAKGLQFPVVIYPFADEKFRATRKNLWVTLKEDLAKPIATAFLPMHKSLEGTDYVTLYNDENSRSEMDAVNVLYVAMTRPEERLYVITKALPEKTESPVTASKLFSYFFQSEGLYSKEKDIYQFGDRYSKPVSVKPVDYSEDSSAEPLTGKPALKLMLRKHAPPSWEMDEPDKNRDWGILVHSLLSRVIEEGDIDGLLGEMLIRGDITGEQTDDLKQLAKGLIKDPRFAVLFSPGYEVRNEAEIISGDGISYRPDRILLKGKQVMIADYKTGSFTERHRGQISNYAGLLKEMGYNVEGAYLVYLNVQPELVRVI